MVTQTSPYKYSVWVAPLSLSGRGGPVGISVCKLAFSELLDSLSFVDTLRMVSAPSEEGFGGCISRVVPYVTVLCPKKGFYE